MSEVMNDKKKETEKTEYEFGGIEEFNLQAIEEEILNDSIYLDVFAGCDIRLKKEISPLENGLESILKLSAYEFNYRSDKFPEKNLETHSQIGVMAQDVEKVYPQAVTVDKEGFRYVNYKMLTSGLIEAVKDLHQIVDKQGKVIEDLCAKLKEN
jgi:hypothetical protein